MTKEKAEPFIPPDNSWEADREERIRKHDPELYEHPEDDECDPNRQEDDDEDNHDDDEVEVRRRDTEEWGRLYEEELAERAAKRTMLEVIKRKDNASPRVKEKVESIIEDHISRKNDWASHVDRNNSIILNFKGMVAEGQNLDEDLGYRVFYEGWTKKDFDELYFVLNGEPPHW